MREEQDETLGLELQEGFPHWNLAYAQLVRYLFLPDSLSRPEAAIDDG